MYFPHVAARIISTLSSSLSLGRARNVEKSTKKRGKNHGLMMRTDGTDADGFCPFMSVTIFQKPKTQKIYTPRFLVFQGVASLELDREKQHSKGADRRRQTSKETG